MFDGSYISCTAIYFTYIWIATEPKHLVQLIDVNCDIVFDSFNSKFTSIFCFLFTTSGVVYDCKQYLADLYVYIKILISNNISWQFKYQQIATKTLELSKLYIYTYIYIERDNKINKNGFWKLHSSPKVMAVFSLE